MPSTNQARKRWRLSDAARCTSDCTPYIKLVGQNDSLPRERLVLRSIPMIVRRAVTILVFAIVGIIAAFSAGGAQPASARAVIERFNDTLLKVMQEADTLGYSDRYEILAPAVRSSFALGFMAPYAAGRHGQELSEATPAGTTDPLARTTIT